MRILRGFFSKDDKEPRADDVLKIARMVGPLIDGAANDIFMSHKMKLLSEPITYIVPAVWGAKKDGELSATQKEINRQVSPLVRQILEQFEFEGLTNSQEFAVEFLVRGLIISKTTYMIEAVKGRVTHKIGSRERDRDKKEYGLEHLEPVGTA